MAGALTSDVEQLRRALVQTLAADPRPVYRWRREQKSGGAADYDVHVDGVEWRCRFELASPDADAERVTVLGPSALFRGR